MRKLLVGTGCSKLILQRHEGVTLTGFAVSGSFFAPCVDGFSVKAMTELRAKHAPCSADSVKYGVDGETGAIIDVVKEQIWDSLAVKQQIFKTAIEAVGHSGVSLSV